MEYIRSSFFVLIISEELPYQKCIVCVCVCAFRMKLRFVRIGFSSVRHGAISSESASVNAWKTEYKLVKEPDKGKI